MVRNAGCLGPLNMKLRNLDPYPIDRIRQLFPLTNKIRIVFQEENNRHYVGQTEIGKKVNLKNHCLASIVLSTMCQA